MTATGPDEYEVTAEFPRTDAARAARDALVAAGVRPADISLLPAAVPERAGEAPFLWRVLAVIVLWSILGAVVGAVLGVLLALTVGPGGTQGVIVQVVAWTVLGHLVAGMLAGYSLLSDRSHREMEPDRSRSHALLLVRSRDRDQTARILAILREQGAGATRVGESARR